MVSGSIQRGLRQPPGHVSIMPPLWKYAQHRFLQSLHLYEASPLWSDTQGRKQSCNHCLISHFPSLPLLRVVAAAACQLLEREAGSQKHHYQIVKERLLAGLEAHYIAARQAAFSISTYFFLSRRIWADEGAIAPSASQDKSWFITKMASLLLICCYGLGFGWLGFCFGLFFPWEIASLIQSTYFRRGLFQEFQLHTFLCGSQYWAREVGSMKPRLFQVRSLEEVLLTTQSPIWKEWELHGIKICV